MKIVHSFLLITSVICLASVSHANISFFTSFNGSEGYVGGGLDRSTQTGAVHFNVPSQGLYLPDGQAPDFGYVAKNPTSGSPKAYYVNGEGATYIAGSNWTVASSFSFEGLDSTAPSSTTFLNNIGFSTSNNSDADTMAAGIQKTDSQTDQYTFYISGGGFAAVSFNYSDIGDDTANADDLTDILEIEIKLEKSSTADEFIATATLTNLDTSTTVATLDTTLSNPNANNKDLFGLISSGTVTEADNWDLFSMYDFRYSAVVPEAQSYALILGTLTLLYIHFRRRQSARS